MPSPRVTALAQLIDETRHLFHRLASAADHAHFDLGIPASQRAVLETLYRDGSQSVPRIARAKQVTRQHIQAVVNLLSDANLVESQDNPAHRRSPLLTLTVEGRRTFEQIAEREQRILENLSRRFRVDDLEQASTTLRRLADVIDDSDFGASSNTEPE